MNDYFSSISKTEPAKEKYDTGEVTAKGEPIFAYKDAINDVGRTILVTKWFAPPSVSGLCLFLGITKDELQKLRKDERYEDVLAHAELVLESYVEQLLHEGRQSSGLLARLDKNELAAEKETEQEMLGVERKIEILKEAAELLPK